MSDVKKPIRLVDVGELEADLKKDLAEEEAKGMERNGKEPSDKERYWQK